MTTTQINQQLYRPIKSGFEYNRYFDSSSCKSVRLATGNTKVAIDNMKKWAIKYAYQSENIAPVLAGETLHQTVSNIQNFLYWHFQYVIDGREQNLKAPACAWATRNEGQDCKTYSILASTILLNLGVKHYLRRIKQDVMSDAFTHVYVVVPNNQKTGKLNKGYTIIDGTIEKNNEIPFLKKDDIYMEPKLPINGLAHPINVAAESCNCGCADNGFENNLGLGISFSDIGGLFNGGWSLSCIGGTYDAKDFNAFAQSVTSGFDNLYYPFNDALRSLDINQIETLANTIFTTSQQLLNHTLRTKSHRWSSKCSKNTTKGFYELAEYFHNIYERAFFRFIEKYFDVRLVQVTLPNNDYVLETRVRGNGMKKHEFVKDVTVTAIGSMSLKPTITYIPKFEFTPYLLENVETTDFNVNSFFETLANTAVTIATSDNGSSSNSSATTTTTSGNTGNNAGVNPTANNNNNNSNPSKAGSTALGILALSAIAGGFVYKKYFKK